MSSARMRSELLRGWARVYSTLISGYFSRKALKKLLSCPSSGVPDVNLTFPSFFANATISPRLLPKPSGPGEAACARLIVKKMMMRGNRINNIRRPSQRFFLLPFYFSSGRLGLGNFLGPGLDDNRLWWKAEDI